MDGKPGHKEPLPIPGPDPGLLDLGKLEDRISRLLYSYQFQRKRRLEGQPIRMVEIPIASSIIETSFQDAASITLRYSWVLPFDWVWGTPITFHALFLQLTTATPNVIWNSSLGADRFGGTWSGTNLENVAGISTAIPLNTVTEVVRGGPTMLTTLMGLLTSTDYDYKLEWALTRQGAHVDDTVNGTVYVRHVWMEYYSTYDYQNLIND